jgi:TonB family protein
MVYTHAYRARISGKLTAHDRLKRSFVTYVSAAVIVSVAAHFAVLRLATINALPDLRGSYGAPIEQLALEQPVDIPPPPEAVPRPAVPVLSTRLDIDSEITIASVTFRDNPISSLPVPTLPEVADIAEQPRFTPYEVRPEMRNALEVQRALEQRYPRHYRTAGIGGRSLLWVFIDEAGLVRRTRVVESSGYDDLDQIAMEVMQEIAKFTPAYNRDVRVPVWIQVPVTFSVA